MGYVLATAPRHLPFSDSLYYQLQSISLADGRGFVLPLVSGPNGHSVPSAAHPPLYPLLLAAGSLVGARSVLAHQLIGCAVGVGTVVGAGLIGHRLGGERSGLLAMGLAAIYPPLWVNDGGIMAEGLFTLITTGVILASYRLAERPSGRSAALLGAMVGLAMLTRAEALLLFVVLVAPLLLAVAGGSLRRLLLLSGVTAMSAGLLLTPWVVRNLVTFHHPVFLSTGDATLLGSNCHPAYYGPGTGAWYSSCYSQVRSAPGGDESDYAAAARRAGLRYISSHAARVPVVVAVRVARTWQLYAPIQGAGDDRDDGRPPWCTAATSVGYALVAPAGLAGLALAVRRRRPVLPLTAQLLGISLTAALVWGAVRFRAPAELAMVVLAAFALDIYWARRAGIDTPGRAEAPEHGPG